MPFPQVYGDAPTQLSYQGNDTSLILSGSGYDLASSQAECVLGTGIPGASSVQPAGSSNFGFADTTYTPTTAQILTETTVGAS